MTYKKIDVNREDPYQRILRKTFERRIPLTVHWEVSYRCQLSCCHCYADVLQDEDELSLHEMTDVMDQLVDAGAMFLTFTGGDPFVRKDIMDILTAAHQRRFAIRLMTNAVQINAERAHRLSMLNLLGIDISLYAMNPEVHDRITGVPGSHAAVLNGIEWCRKFALPLALKCPLMTHNLDEFQAVCDFARDIEADFVFDYLLVPADSTRQPMQEVGLTDEQMYLFLLDKVDIDTARKPEAPALDDPVCGAGSNAVAINPYGDIYPCLGYRKTLGNIRKQSFVDIWASPYLDRLHAARYRNYEECEHCDKISYCSRCPGISRAECGMPFDSAPTICRVAAATKRAVDERIQRAVI